VSAVCSIVTAVAAIVAVVSFVVGVQRERVKAAQDAIARIYPMDTEIERFLAANPSLRDYLRSDPDGKRWEKFGDAEARERFQVLCAMNGNLFEYYMLIRDNIRDHPRGGEIIAAWDENFRDLCRQSFAFRGYVRATWGYWGSSFQREFERHTEGLPHATNVRPAAK
jgi:hypothetical protein